MMVSVGVGLAVVVAEGVAVAVTMVVAVTGVVADGTAVAVDAKVRLTVGRTVGVTTGVTGKPHEERNRLTSPRRRMILVIVICCSDYNAFFPAPSGWQGQQLESKASPNAQRVIFWPADKILRIISPGFIINLCWINLCPQLDLETRQINVQGRIEDQCNYWRKSNAGRDCVKKGKLSTGKPCGGLSAETGTC